MTRLIIIITVTIVAFCSCKRSSSNSEHTFHESGHLLIADVNVAKQHGYFNKVVYINTNADNSLELLRIQVSPVLNDHGLHGFNGFWLRTVKLLR